MDGNLNNKENLIARIQQLERERDDLQKDIERLCMQQSGPSIFGAGTRMHFQRTASLEQEIEDLKLTLTACAREKLNLEEELAEAYRVKTQLADLHAAEVAKNLEAEKQVKFFQGCVAAAFAERDNSIMEAEKAKEKEELMLQKLNDNENRLEELTSDCLEQKKLIDTLQVDLVKLEEQIRSYGKVIDKFYEIRANSLGSFEEMALDDKCVCLLCDPVETWTFNDPSTSKYVSALEEELEKMKSAADNLQSKLRMGLEIENHLKKKVRELEKKNILSNELVISSIADLRHYHSKQRVHIMDLLNEGGSYFKSISETLEEKVRQFVSARIQHVGPPNDDVKLDEYECRDVHITAVVESDVTAKNEEPGLPNETAEKKSDLAQALAQALQETEESGLPDNTAEKKGDTSGVLAQALQEKRKELGLPDNATEKKGDASEALKQALQEKVAALLLLSQQDERHLLERNVNAVLQKRIEELQRNLLQVTNEKVKVLVELARLKQEYQSLKEKTLNSGEQGKTEISERRLIAHEREGKLKNLLKKSYLKRWIGPLDSGSNEVRDHLNSQADLIKIEYATLKESTESMEHLITSIRRLRLALSKVKECVDSGTTVTKLSEAIGNIITEANLLKTALGISIPISWSAEPEVDSPRGSESSSEKIDSVSAAGFEMVELILLAVDILKNNANKEGLVT